MIKNSFWVAVILGILLPWILFAGKEEQLACNNQKEKELQHQYSQLELKKIIVGTQNGEVNEVELERYVLGVIIAEMPESFDIEALKAQAVVARTFAVKSDLNRYKHSDYAVCTYSGCCQSYYDPDEFISNGGAIGKFQEAVDATCGQVLLYDDVLIEATYFSCSGGKTEDAQAVWGTDVPYLQAKSSPGEENAEHYTDTVTFTAEEFQNLIGQKLLGEPGSWFEQVTYTDGGGVDTIKICGISYTGMEMRNMLGLFSTAFVISAVGNRVTITTKGFGHRVGMSQYGADAMAIRGCGYKEILSYYYPDTVLEIYSDV